MSVGLKGRKTSFPEKSGGVNPYKQFCSGRIWLKKLTQRETELGVPVYNVTFEPGCRNNWHKHTGGQMLIGVGGVGYCHHACEAQQLLAEINTGYHAADDLAGKRIVPFFTGGGSGAGKTLDYLKPSAPKATFETPKNLTHADESAIRTWVQRRLKRSISVSDCFPTFAVDIATNLLLYCAPSLPQR